MTTVKIKPLVIHNAIMFNMNANEMDTLQEKIKACTSYVYSVGCEVIAPVIFQEYNQEDERRIRFFLSLNNKIENIDEMYEFQERYIVETTAHFKLFVDSENEDAIQEELKECNRQIGELGYEVCESPYQAHYNVLGEAYVDYFAPIQELQGF